MYSTRWRHVSATLACNGNQMWRTRSHAEQAFSLVGDPASRRTRRDTEVGGKYLQRHQTKFRYKGREAGNVETADMLHGMKHGARFRAEYLNCFNIFIVGRGNDDDSSGFDRSIDGRKVKNRRWYPSHARWSQVRRPHRLGR